MSNLSELLPSGSSGKKVSMTDSGSGIAASKPVILESDGTVSQVVQRPAGFASFGTIGSLGSFGDMSERQSCLIYNETLQVWYYFWRRSNGYLYYSCFSYSGGTYTVHRATTYAGYSLASSGFLTAGYAKDLNMGVICFPEVTGYGANRPRVSSIDFPTDPANAITIGNASFQIDYYGAWASVAIKDNGDGVVAYNDIWSNVYNYALGFQLLSWGAFNQGSAQAVRYNGSQNGFQPITYSPDGDRWLIATFDNSYYWYIHVFSISTYNISSVGSFYLNSSGTMWPSDSMKLSYDWNHQRLHVFYGNNWSSGYPQNEIYSWSSTGYNGMTYQTGGTLQSTSIQSDYYATDLDYNRIDKKVFYAWRKDAGNTASDTVPWYYIQSGSFGQTSAAYLWSASSPTNFTGKVNLAAATDTSQVGFGIVGDTGGGSSVSSLSPYEYHGQSTNLTASNFFGVSTGAISASASGDIAVNGGTIGGITLTHGAGVNYYVQDDGSFGPSAGSFDVKAGLGLGNSTLLLKGVF